MSNFNKQFIELMKKELNFRKTKIIKELSSFTTASKKDPKTWKSRFPNRGHSDDENAQEVASFSGRVSLERTLKDTLKDIEHALTRIKNGSYGVCKYCGNMISEARLKARPVSSSCIDCKKSLKGE